MPVGRAETFDMLVRIYAQTLDEGVSFFYHEVAVVRVERGDPAVEETAVPEYTAEAYFKILV
jgi:hypothetical protein